MFDQYKNYRLTDFVRDEAFVRWVYAPGPADIRFWEAFLEACPYQEQTVRQAVQALHDLKAAAAPTGEVAADKAAIWRELDQEIGADGRPLRSYRVWWQRGVAAAMLLLLAGVGWWFSGNKKEQPVYQAGGTGSMDRFEVVTNSTGQTDVVQLPDRSSVFLKPGAELRFVRDFAGNTREVHLVGEAFFEVTRNPEKPFVVFANGLVTKVLGTSFTIRAEAESDHVTVAVKSGKVSVFSAEKSSADDPETSGLILRPNQQAAFSRTTEKLTRSLVLEPVPVVPPETLQTLQFRNAPVTTIFQAIEKAYGIEIVFDQELLGNCRLNSSLGNEDLFEILDILCAAIDGSYKVVDAQVVITARKCQ